MQFQRCSSRWDLDLERNVDGVVDYSGHYPGSPGANQNSGFSIYAGPDNPSDPTSPMVWQLWMGTGDAFVQASAANPDPKGLPLVTADDTYRAVRFGIEGAFLSVFGGGADVSDADINMVEHALSPPVYMVPRPLDTELTVALAFGPMIPPFPGPQFGMYPFKGRVAWVAVYNRDIGQMRIVSHITNAFFHPQ